MILNPRECQYVVIDDRDSSLNLIHNKAETACSNGEKFLSVLLVSVSVKAGMGIGERNQENDGNAGNQSGNAWNQSGNAGNSGGNAGNQDGNDGNQDANMENQGGNAGNQAEMREIKLGTTGIKVGIRVDLRDINWNSKNKIKVYKSTYL